MKKSRHILLAENSTAQAIHVLSSRVSPVKLSEAGSQSWVTLTRVGTFTDPRYGQFSITPAMLINMVKQFDARVVGTDIFLDVSHEPDEGAAAKILRLSVEGNRLRALVEWTEYGINAVKKRGFRYLSAEYYEDWRGNEVGVNDFSHGAVLTGAGLTLRPVITGNDPITLSIASRASDTTQSQTPSFVHPDLAHKLLTEAKNTMKRLPILLAYIAASALSEKDKADYKALAETQLKDVTDDAQAKALCDTIEANVWALAEKPATNPTTAPTADNAAVVTPPAATASSTTPPAVTLSEAQVADIVAKQLAKTQQDAAATQKTLSDKRALLTTTINAAEGLDDGLKKELSDAATSFVTASMTDEQVKALAQMQIDQGNKVIAARKLANMGYTVNGTPHIQVVDEGSMKLSQMYIDNLKKTNAAGKLHLDDKAPVPTFVAMVLSQFDAVNARELHNEAKFLAEGSGTLDTTNAQLPAGVIREVIRQALSDTNVLSLVQTLTDFSAQATTNIPFETRDTSQIIGDGIVFEGQPIPFASVSQKMEAAWVNQMKIALSVTNEIVHFSRSSAINWDAMARNIEMNARILRELVHRRLCNEVQRASDSYLAMAVSNESFTAQLGAKDTIKTVNFPVVAPFQARDLRGNAQGLAENPITVVLNSTVCLPYDGSGKQPAGTYYVISNHNIGLITFVSETGVKVQPAATGTNTISYSAATNVMRVNIDTPEGSTPEKQWNQVLRAIGSRRAAMKSERYVLPNFALMSSLMNENISNAEEFVFQNKRNGTDTTVSGDLDTVKKIKAVETDAPGIHLGDERVVLGVSGTTTYTMVKPYSVGNMVEGVDAATGRPTGTKVAYGEEYNSIYTPIAIRDRYTSVVTYSAAARAAL